VTAPADNDHVALKSIRLGKDSLYRCLVDDTRLRIGPPSRECTPRTRRLRISIAIER
jgi:hypothetical protein